MKYTISLKPMEEKVIEPSTRSYCREVDHLCGSWSKASMTMSQRLWLARREQDAPVCKLTARMVPNRCTHSMTSFLSLMKAILRNLEHVYQLGRTFSMSRKRNQRRLRRTRGLRSESISNLILIEALRVKYIQLIKRRW